MRRWRPLLAFLLLALLAAAGASFAAEPRRPGKIRIEGSDTMLLLARPWAESFMASHPGVAVEVTGGGSAKGLRALVAGTADIATASRPLTPEEAREMVEHRGSLGYSVLTARDALSVYLHPGNSVQTLTLAQLRGIFTGEIRRWSELGGVDAPIAVINRNPASGTRLFFAEHVLGGASYARRAKVVPTTAAVIAAVAGDPHAIGYGGIGYGGIAYGDERAAGVSLCTVDGVAPSARHVRDGSYPIARYLYLYTASPPRGRVKDFIDWVLSDDGQEVVRRLGYVALHSSPERAVRP